MKQQNLERIEKALGTTQAFNAFLNGLAGLPTLENRSLEQREDILKYGVSSEFPDYQDVQPQQIRYNGSLPEREF